MDFILEQNRAQCAAILEALLAAPAFSFDEKLPSRLPVQHGLDVIARNGGSGQCEYLARWSFQDGILGTTQPDLDQHFWGGGRGAESDLVDKVVKNIPLGIPP
ncbi:MAG: hypothetical protein JO033_25225, partial [Acidobacteriaceae bacterium]|nr:hypothetical protein [Acidobacteriaceae bacterium]